MQRGVKSQLQQTEIQTMKSKPNQSDNGHGHKAKFAVVINATVEIDGKKQQFHVDYDVSVTVEQVDYIVRQIAGGIAQAAGKVARDGIAVTA